MGKIEQFRETLAAPKEERIVPNGHPPKQLFIREQRIEKRLKSIEKPFFEIGKELAEIKKEHEYPESTFELYIQRRWGHTRQWAYRMIQGYETVMNVTPGLQNSYENKELTGIETEKQARELAKAPPEKQAEVLEAVAKKGMKKTAKAIKEEVKKQSVESEFRVIVKDANDDEVPEKIAEEFSRSRREVKEIRSKLNEVRRWLEDEQQYKAEIARTAAIDSVKDVLSMIAVGAGDYICPICKGEKCKVCSKRGFVSKLFYSQKISDDKK